jgi:hypothetical protein
VSCHLRFYLNGWTIDPGIERRQGIHLAQRALEMTRDDPVVIANAAYVGHLPIEQKIVLPLASRELHPVFPAPWHGPRFAAISDAQVC